MNPIQIMHPSTTTPLDAWTRSLFVSSSTCCLSSWFLTIGTYQLVYAFYTIPYQLYCIYQIGFSFLIWYVRYPFAAQVVPSLYAKSTPIEVTNALQRNQSMLVLLAVSMNARSQLLYRENGVLGWPVWSCSMYTHFRWNKFVIGSFEFTIESCNSCLTELSIDDMWSSVPSVIISREWLVVMM